MPIIDSYTLLGAWPRAEAELTLEALAGGMQARGIGLSLVTHTSAIFYDCATGNRQAEAVSKGNVPLMPVAVLNPLQYPTCLEELRRCLDAGIRAFRLCPREHGYPFSDQVGPLVELLPRLSEAKLLSVDLTGLPIPSLGSGLTKLLPIPTTFTAGPDQLGLLFQAGKNHPNVWLETSALDAGGAVEAAVKHLGVERVVFGSRSPLRSSGSAVMTVQFAEVTDADRLAIFEGNLRRLLS